MRSSEEFKEVRFVIERWKTLQTTWEQLKAAAEQSAEETEQQRILLQKYTEEKANEILGYNNEIVNLQKELEALMEHTLHGENEISERTDILVNKALEHSQVKMCVSPAVLQLSLHFRATENIFRRFLAKSKQKYKRGSPLHQLKLIGMFLEDYTDIVRAYRGSRVTSLQSHHRKGAPAGGAQPIPFKKAVQGSVLVNHTLQGCNSNRVRCAGLCVCVAIPSIIVSCVSMEHDEDEEVATHLGDRLVFEPKNSIRTSEVLAQQWESFKAEIRDIYNKTKQMNWGKNAGAQTPSRN